MNVHAPALAEVHPLDEQTSAFARDAIGDLSQHPKKLSPKYFYDAAGSELFEQITLLPEYYPTRTELGILNDRGGEIARSSRKSPRWSSSAPARPPRCACCSSAASSGPMCRSTSPAISSRRRPTRLRRISPSRHLSGGGRLHDAVRAAGRRSPICRRSASSRARPSAISSRMRPRPSCAARARSSGDGAQMIIGVDLEKDERVLHAAYNDAAGVTARFNLNVLVRINRELGGNFDLSAFTHRAIYNHDRHRIEMHLISRKAQTVRLLGTSFSFRPARASTPRTATNTASSALLRWRGARAGGAGKLDGWRRCSRCTRWRRRSNHSGAGPRLRDGTMRGAGTQASPTRSALNSQAWMIRHLSWPRDWKSRSGDLPSSSSKKNFRESLPSGPPGSTACLATQRSHFFKDEVFRFLLFHRRTFPAMEFHGGWSYRAGQGSGEKMSAPPRAQDIFRYRRWQILIKPF